MVGIINIVLTIGAILTLFMAAFGPLIFKIFVNNKIEKRYNCKLNVEQENVRYVFLYSYFKYVNPAKTIAMAYLFRSQKMIDRIKSLKDINYKLKTAPKKEVFICFLFWLIGVIGFIFMVTGVILIKIYNIKP